MNERTAEKSRRVALADLRPDDVLAEPITDAHGGVLMAAGTHLNASVIERLGNRGVAEAVVVDAAVPASRNAEHATAADRERVKARIEYLFRRDLRNNAIHPLMHLVWRYRSEEDLS
jgi:hypothetical protein